MKTIQIMALAAIAFSSTGRTQTLTYPIVDTGVHTFYSNYSIITEPAKGDAFYGQDASYQGNEPSYTDNGDGTVTDNVSGLIWQKDMGSKITYFQALGKADTMKLGGYTDWRIPTIKELYSLIQFNGQVNGMTPVKTFLDTKYFNQPYGNTDAGERLIDAQTWSCTQYKGTTMFGDSVLFGVNFIDGRIKAYPKYQPGSNYSVPKSMYFRMVRGNSTYGKNNFRNNGDGTVTDLATGLMWQQADDGQSRDWVNALIYAGNLSLADYSDWRLPNAKELQSIVDYNRCPQTSHSAAIDPVFKTSTINFPDGTTGQYPYFWTGTSHLESSSPYSQAVYIAFGEATGKINGTLIDAHGAGAQRSDPKTGDATLYPQYMGPQGDERVVFNYVRCVRTVNAAAAVNVPRNSETIKIIPNPVRSECKLIFNTTHSDVNILISSMPGKNIKAIHAGETAADNSLTINLTDLSRGIYLMNVSDSCGFVASEKISKI